MEQAQKPSGIDTEKTWLEFQENRAAELKNRLVMHYISLVNSIVNRMMPVYGAHMSYDDLLGYGVLGLIDAVEKFVPARGIRFESYASKRIKGEIIDNIRSQDWASSSLRTRIKQISQAVEELEADGQTDTGDEAVAARLGLDVQQVRTALEKAHMFNLVRFETLLSGAEEGNVTLQDTLRANEEEAPEQRLVGKEFSSMLAHSIDKLTQNERKIITLYYYEELMLKDIAEILNVTPARVSQIHSRALMKIRLDVEKYDQDSRN